MEVRQLTTTVTKQSDKLMKARCRLLTREPWFGHVAMSMVWIPSRNLSTMGVRIVNGGEIQCLYSPEFVDNQSVQQLFGVIQHEIEHIVRVHTIRVGGREPQAWNIAADMCVNGQRSHPRIGYSDPNTNELILPLDGNIVFIPDDFPKDGTSEQFYEMLNKRQKQKCCASCGKPMQGKKDKGSKAQSGAGGKQDDDGDQAGAGGGGETGDAANKKPCPGCGQIDDGMYEYGGVTGRAIDDHSVWNQTDVSEDEVRQVVKNIVDQATQKCQGHTPGHLVEAIQQLGKPVVRWRELLRQYLGQHVGNQRRTYSRRNRRNDVFGMPGISHHAAATCNVIVDTSGSIGAKELEQFFAEIDMIASRTKVMVLQWDHAFQGWNKYRRGDWRRFNIHGRGGTDMAAPIQWLIDNNLVADVQVLLSDGYANWHEQCSFPMITVLTTAEGATTGPTWGHTIRMTL